MFGRRKTCELWQAIAWPHQCSDVASITIFDRNIGFVCGCRDNTETGLCPVPLFQLFYYLLVVYVFRGSTRSSPLGESDPFLCRSLASCYESIPIAFSTIKPSVQTIRTIAPLNRAVIELMDSSGPMIFSGPVTSFNSEPSAPIT